jgi:predicted SprT family Zn-dependent metalloprotease
MSAFQVYQSTPTDKLIHVHAFEMSDTQFKYKCACRLKFHRHGNGGDPLTNRQEYRSGHCLAQPGELCIHITDKTIRKLKCAPSVT